MEPVRSQDMGRFLVPALGVAATIVLAGTRVPCTLSYLAVASLRHDGARREWGPSQMHVVLDPA